MEGAILGSKMNYIALPFLLEEFRGVTYDSPEDQVRNSRKSLPLRVNFIKKNGEVISRDS